MSNNPDHANAGYLFYWEGQFFTKAELHIYKQKKEANKCQTVKTAETKQNESQN